MTYSTVDATTVKNRSLKNTCLEFKGRGHMCTVNYCEMVMYLIVIQEKAEGTET